MVDLAAAPRRALNVTLQAGIVLAVGVPMVAITQPLLPGVPVGGVLVGLLGVLAVAFWRSTNNLDGHVQAGVEVISEALMAHNRTAQPQTTHALEEVEKLLPGLGLGAPSLVELVSGSHAVGKTLAELNLRGITGATVLAIARGPQAILATATEVLQAEDRLALAGSREAIDAAREVLAPPVAVVAQDASHA